MSEGGPEPAGQEDRRSAGDPTGSGESVGTVAEEAAKLFGALGEALGVGAAAGETAAGGGSAGDEPSGPFGLAGLAARAWREIDRHVATGAPECSYCPLCRTVSTVRQVTPEVRTHLLTAADALAQAASGWLATVTADQPADRDRHDRDRPDRDRPDRDRQDRSAGVGHIDPDGTETDLEEDGR